MRSPTTPGRQHHIPSPSSKTELCPLPPLTHLRLRLTLKARESAHLPDYKGSMLRGAFGHALRRAVCTRGPKQPCASCTLRHDCVYTRLFEPLRDREPPPFLGGQPASPRPYLIEPRASPRSFRPGDTLELDLLLFGEIAKLQAYALQAVDRMAASGLGARRARFQLVQARYQDARGEWQTGYQRAIRRWPGKVAAVAPPPKPLPADRALLRFVTPTRLKVDGRLVGRITFPLLAGRLLRRILELAHFYGPEPVIDGDFGALLERAEEIRVRGSRLRWHDWQRYSNRQQSKMKLGGFVGEVTVEGDFAPFSQLLRMGEIVHLGKGVTFGLGKMTVA